MPIRGAPITFVKGVEDNDSASTLYDNLATVRSTWLGVAKDEDEME